MRKLSFKLIQYASPEYKAAVSLREQVLWIPLGLTVNKKELATEEGHIHFGAYVDDELVATAALVPDGPHGKMQRVAVKAEQQKQGYGAQLVQFIENEARNQGYKTIYCSAQDTAASFYTKLGYIAEGEFYLEDSIPHLVMRKLLIGNIEPAGAEDIREIDQKLGAFNQAMIGFSGGSEKPIAYAIKRNGEMIAGISACLDWGYVVHVDLLFVAKDYRNLGLGSHLLRKVEGEARVIGAGLAQTDTFDFQAKDFYLKHGYKIFGVVDDSPRPGHKRYYLKKVLTSP